MFSAVPCFNIENYFLKNQGEISSLCRGPESRKNPHMNALLKADLEKMVSPEAIGARIRLIRRTTKLSQGGFAEAIGTSRDLVNAWENGKSYPSPRDVLSVIARFGGDFNYIYIGDERRVEAELLRAILDLPEEKVRRKPSKD